MVERRLLLLMPSRLSRGLRRLVRRVLVGATLSGGRPRVRLVVDWWWVLRLLVMVSWRWLVILSGGRRVRPLGFSGRPRVRLVVRWWWPIRLLVVVSRWWLMVLMILSSGRLVRLVKRWLLVLVSTMGRLLPGLMVG